MTNDETSMSRDELIAAFAQLHDPAWLATLPEPPSYRQKQHRRYREALALGWHGTAMDAVWRAASEADMLTQAEHRDNDLPPARMIELIGLLDWS